MKILDNINSPADLKKLNLQQLNQLSAEIRNEMIEKVSKTGGHIAPSLGVVELTLALHRVFNSPQDKFIWDVGHQSYVHKIITGRRDKFHTLRQHEGLSGFPKRNESSHDSFDTGHSSTSISAALGIALARDLNKEIYNVLAIIGDGALTGGMAFEALNHAGHVGTKIIVILNDNEMSIVENVGALSGYLSRMRTDPKYYKGKEDLEYVLKRLPLGNVVLKAAERIKDSFKYLVVPGMLFEELGFTYLGPVDGHNIEEVKEVLEHAKNADGPVVVHVITKKGKGYKPAEDNPDKFHGVGPFVVETGETIGSKNKSYTQVFGETLEQLAETNEKIVTITAAMPSGTGLTSFARKFSKRFFDVGIAEQHAVTFAAGLATQGFKPVVAIYSTFLQRAYDQILHDVALQKLPVVFAIDRAGLVGEDGETHQGVFDLSFLRHIPNMILMAPKDENELRSMLKTAVKYNDGPIAVRYPRGSGEGVELPEDYNEIPIGKAEVLKEGKDVTILAIGNTVYNSMKAAEELAMEGIDATVINCRFVKPLDAECIIKYAKNTKKIITIEEHVLPGGFGSAVMELLETQNTKVLVHRIGIPDEFVCHSTTSIQREKYGLTPAKIAATVKKELGK